MKIRNAFTFYAVVNLIFGIGFLLFPASLFALYGAEAGDAFAVASARLSGAFAVGTGLMAWMARRAEPSSARNAMALGFTVIAVLGAVLGAWATLSGLYSPTGWSAVALFAVMAYSMFTSGRAKVRTA